MKAKIQRTLVISTLACALIASFWRLFFGVDFTDEATYVALPFSFLKGYLPFIDEKGLWNTSAMLAVPFAWVFSLFKSPDNGSVLFFREIFWFAMVSTGALVGFILYRARPVASSLLPAAVLPLFIPYSIPSWSYNTMAVAGLTLGSFAYFLGSSSAFFGLGVLAFTFATVAYPPLLLPVSLFLIFYAFKNRRPNFVAIYFVLISLFGLALISIFGLPTLLQNYRTDPTHEFTWSKIQNILLFIPSNFLLFFSPITLVGLAISFLGKMKKNSDLIMIGVLVGLVGCWTADPNFYILRICFWSALAWVFLDAVKARPKLLLIWALGFLSGICALLSTDNGWIGFSVGAIPAVVSVATAVVWYEQNGKFSEKFQVGSLSAILMLSGLTYSSFSKSYRDLPPLKLDTEIESGPYAGLWTSNDKAQFVNEIQSAIKSSIPPDAESFVGFYDCSFCFLITNAKPLTPNIWVKHWVPIFDFTLSFYLDYFSKPSNRPGYALLIRRFPLDSEIWIEHQPDPLQKVFIENYTPVQTTRNFSILRKK